MQLRCKIVAQHIPWSAICESLTAGNFTKLNPAITITSTNHQLVFPQASVIPHLAGWTTDGYHAQTATRRARNVGLFAQNQATTSTPDGQRPPSAWETASGRTRRHVVQVSGNWHSYHGMLLQKSIDNVSKHMS